MGGKGGGASRGSVNIREFKTTMELSIIPDSYIDDVCIVGEKRKILDTLLEYFCTSTRNSVLVRKPVNAGRSGMSV